MMSRSLAILMWAITTGLPGVQYDPFTQVTRLVEDAYLQPLALHSVMLTVRTEPFEAGTTAERFWITVSEKQGCCNHAKSHDGQLLEVYVRVRGGHVESIHARGDAIDRLPAGSTDDVKKRMADVRAVLREATGWGDDNGVAELQRDGRRWRIVFMNQNGKKDPATNAALFDRRTGVLLLAGVP